MVLGSGGHFLVLFIVLYRCPAIMTFSCKMLLCPIIHRFFCCSWRIFNLSCFYWRFFNLRNLGIHNRTFFRKRKNGFSASLTHFLPQMLLLTHTYFILSTFPDAFFSLRCAFSSKKEVKILIRYQDSDLRILLLKEWELVKSE